MQIETIIAKLAKYQHDEKRTIPDDILNETKALIMRLEGMFPNVETARKVATTLKVEWPEGTDGTLLAWARTVWPLLWANRVSELLPVVQPHLPKGQPYGESEMMSVDTNLAMAVMSGDKTAEKAARDRKAEMVGHNLMVGGGAPVTPDPVRRVDAGRHPRSKKK